MDVFFVNFRKVERGSVWMNQRHLENQHGDPHFLHILIGNGLKIVSTKFEI